MPKKLKAVIFGLRNVIIQEGAIEKNTFEEVHHLVRYLKHRGILPIFFGNNDWRVNSGEESIPLQTVITKKWGEFEWIVANRDNTPRKPQAAAIAYILSKYKLDAAEIVYIGNTPEDMQTAVNGKVLFLNATWYGHNTDYGFTFAHPKIVARFIDTFCLRNNLWHYKIDELSLRYYAFAPYSTSIPEYSLTSSDAKNAAKFGGGHLDFWTQYLWSTIYFAELHKEVDYITVFPSHTKDSGNSIMSDPMKAFSKCFRIGYLEDFIERHTTATKLQTARINKIPINHTIPLSTIRLRRDPIRTGTTRYKNCPVRTGKKVLVIDDFCTQGYSLESARAYIQQTGAQVISLSWGKTINSDYRAIQDIDKFDPFVANIFKDTSFSKIQYPYKKYIVEEWKPGELNQKFKDYDDWAYPAF